MIKASLPGYGPNRQNNAIKSFYLGACSINSLLLLSEEVLIFQLHIGVARARGHDSQIKVLTEPMLSPEQNEQA